MLRVIRGPTGIKERYNTVEARDGAVVEALQTNRKVAGSIPDGVIGIFH
jgi:hypothetical protein